MGGEDHGAFSRQRADELAGLVDLLGIESRGRFVENEQVGFVHERLREPHPLAVAAAQLPDDAVPRLTEGRALDRARYRLPDPASRDAPQPRCELEEGADLHLRVQRRVFRQIPDPPPDFERSLRDVQPPHQHPSLGGRHEAGDDPHGGRLPGAVRPQKTEDLSPGDAEAEFGHRQRSPVALGDAVHQDQRPVARFHGCLKGGDLDGAQYS